MNVRFSVDVDGFHFSSPASLRLYDDLTGTNEPSIQDISTTIPTDNKIMENDNVTNEMNSVFADVTNESTSRDKFHAETDIIISHIYSMESTKPVTETTYRESNNHTY
ncbi:hypothetical protein GWI33_018045 [Rhynchophorus ferrugineus]|uniref:Uncharacterized protein n=1 Tax=Rhynchophorus ferrugineus TaxID=354439 RepID=A0A834HU85_RHYFE|nr:hypothetical protein GWI33_018045 [Rhynchophorus ferrugineus]